MEAPDTQPTAVPVPPPPDTTNLADTRTPVQQPQPQVASPPPQKHGLAAILAAVGDALGGGATHGQVNPQTGAVEQVNRSTGAKVGSAITTLIRGAAAGAAQHGPGSIGRSAMAGEQSQEDFQQQQQQRLKEQTQNVLETQQNQRANQENERQNQLAQASLAMHNQQMARMSLDREREGLQFSKEQADVANQMQAIQSIPGSKLLGHFASNDQMNKYLENISPEQSQQHAADFAKNLIQAVPNPKGGFDAYQVPKGWQDQAIGPGKKISTFTTEVGKDGKVKPVWKEMDAPPDMKQGEYMTWQGQTLKASTDQETHEAELKQKAAQTRQENAAAAKSEEETKQLKDQTSGTSSRAQLVQDVLHGNIVPERYGYMLGKKEGQEFLAQVSAEAEKEGILLDTAKLAAYPKVYEQFTSTKPGTAGFAVNAGATGLRHLQELMKLNTIASRNPLTKDYKAFHDQLDTLVPELIKFYNMPDTDKSVSSLKGTLGGLLNRDAAIKQQAHALGQKLDEYHQQWKNAAPSPMYQAPMPQMTDEAKYARAHLDPEYAAKLFSVSQWKQAHPEADSAMLQHVESEARKQNLEIVQ